MKAVSVSRLVMVCQLPGRLFFNRVMGDFLVTVLPGQSENVVKVKVKFTLEQATKAQRGRCIALLFLQPRR
jgi:hypothetical protein